MLITEEQAREFIRLADIWIAEDLKAKSRNQQSSKQLKTQGQIDQLYAHVCEALGQFPVLFPILATKGETQVIYTFEFCKNTLLFVEITPVFATLS